MLEMCVPQQYCDGDLSRGKLQPAFVREVQ